MTITIIGSGNIGTFYGTRFVEAGHTIEQVFSRNHEHAKRLALALQAEAIADWQQLKPTADVYVLAISDNALADYIPLFPFKEKTILFASGSISMKELQGISNHYGCLWCLYSIRKEQLPQHDNIPLFLQHNSEQSNAFLKELAASISNQCHLVTDEQKLALHVCAVWVNNFSNHLSSIAATILAENNLHFDFLRPIMLQTDEKLQQNSPLDIQTGPALRHDTQVITKHLAFLTSHPDWQQIYQNLSDSIMHLHKGE